MDYSLVPVPPLPEQQRIVGILDEAFEGIATAKANAEKNLQNARALFESHLQSVFTQRGNGWVEKPLGECCASFGAALVDPRKAMSSMTGSTVELEYHGDRRCLTDMTQCTEESDLAATSSSMRRWCNMRKSCDALMKTVACTDSNAIASISQVSASASSTSDFLCTFYSNGNNCETLQTKPHNQ